MCVQAPPGGVGLELDFGKVVGSTLVQGSIYLCSGFNPCSGLLPLFGVLPLLGVHPCSGFCTSVQGPPGQVASPG